MQKNGSAMRKFTTNYLTNSRTPHKLWMHKPHNSSSSNLPNTWAIIEKISFGHMHTSIPIAHYVE
jgi:hypothetical protein